MEGLKSAPATPNKVVNFSTGKEPGKTREKYLTAKYGSHQMALIRKRLKVEMWMYDKLQEICNIQVVKITTSINMRPVTISIIWSDWTRSGDRSGRSARYRRGFREESLHQGIYYWYPSGNQWDVIYVYCRKFSRIPIHHRKLST